MTRTMRTLLYTAVCLGAASSVRAETVAAASCNAADVLAALNRAAAGDTVVIPAGTCYWTSGISWTAPANVTVLGAGSLAVLGGGDATVIVDNSASGSPLIGIMTNPEGRFRFAGITVRGGSGSIKENGVIGISGQSKQVRIDHIHIDMQAYTIQTAAKPLTVTGVNGVIDHIVVDLARQGFILFSHPNYGGASNGDGAWAAPTGFGTGDFMFLEDNQFNAREDPKEPGVFIGTVTDCNAGGRMVLRYNTIVGAGFAQTHPTGGAGRGRGCRAHEVYGNAASPSADFDPQVDQPPYTFSWISSGPALVWGNTDNGTHKNFIHLDSMRKNADTYPETPTPNGWGWCGSEFRGFFSNWDGNTNTVSGYPCLDQPGQGRGDLLSGDFPNAINRTTGTIAWPRQTLEPIREWLNSFTAVRGWGNDSSRRIGVASGAETRLAENRDYYSYTSSFDGTMGVGVGPRVARPSTCTTGVAYWSIDQGGNWNTTNGSANDGTLDVCTATNTWTNSAYTPYAYPHPLTRSLEPPSNVVIR